ncbi:MAG: hypothetical protein H7Y13_09160 [Sphingobacteriaceae bacterium]|nr:hypothetical protein [Sphingobacteriaceae bacterium]
MRINPKKPQNSVITEKSTVENTDAKEEVKDTSITELLSLIFAFIGVYGFFIKFIFF